uniref:Putative transcriptional regulatory protein n=1 Tax=Talaromyces marneffei PM1 TaxID=1077442 RepID=A0A093UMK8_TALMA
MSSGMGSKHAACTECRQRKVKCHGGQPSCQNCLRRRSQCVFSRTLGQEKEDLLVMISELNNRLSNAEERLAATTTSCNSQTWPHAARADNMTGIASPPLMGLSASVDSGSIDDNAMTLFPDSYGLWNLSEIESNASFVLSPQNSSTNWPNLDLNTEGRDISDTCDMELELSPRELHDLYESYFDQADHNCYMLEKDTFLTKMDHQPLGHELLGLKYIVLAYGASASSTYNHLQNKLYEVSRAYFEKVETWNPLFAIISLQCCTLLATFELQQLLFIRAWDRINRAMWMAELFELHQMDGENEPLRQRTSGLFMAQTTNPEELEERRRTFCICFGSNTNAQINHMEKITTLLPNEHNINDPKALHRRTLYEALNQPMARKLSRFEGFIITTALHVRSLRHANIACVGIKDEHLEYDFWMHHFYITESLSQLYCAQYLEPTLRNSIVLSGTLCMAVRIQATLLCLQHAAVVRGSEIKPAQSFASFGKSKCFMTAMKLMNTIKQMHIQGTLINTAKSFCHLVNICYRTILRS